MDSNRLKRKEAQPIGDILKLFLQANHLAVPHNTQLIFEAWDNASGAAKYTMKRFFRDGRLYITLSSSVVRNQLSFQKQELLEKINALLQGNDLYIHGPEEPVKELILK